MPDVHSKLSPSGASRWLACPGSLEIDGTDEASFYAAEGTVAHEIASQCFLLGLEPSDYLNKSFQQDGFEITVDQEMVDGVKVYLDYISQYISPMTVEHRLEHSEIAGFGGTVDCVGDFQIVDFKYGAGQPVEAKENMQLGCYALLFLDAFNRGEIVDVELTIVQPRAEHPEGSIRAWTASAEWLTDLKERIEVVASGIRSHEIHAGNHCRWCPGRAQCPELYELTLLTAKQEFSAPEMTPEKAAKILDLRQAVKSFIESVERYAHGQLDKGISIPGYKLVDAFGNRRYAVDEATIERRCKSKGFGKKQIYSTELMSPAQLEKVVGKELVSSLVERPHMGTTLVPDSDNREAVKRMTAAEEFAHVLLGDNDCE